MFFFMLLIGILDFFLSVIHVFLYYVLLISLFPFVFHPVIYSFGYSYIGIFYSFDFYVASYFSFMLIIVAIVLTL